jgi:uncharacterized protein YdeI (YjbR/CyaY-like superfamily)
MNSKADWFFNKNTPWKNEYAALRAILHGYGLTEELKWGCPCYTLDKKNVVLIHGFKDYCALLFFKGALLKDPKGVLVQQTANVQSARQIRFTTVKAIVDLKRIIQAYVREAVRIERAGLQVRRKPTSAFKVPEEFALRLKASPALAKAFHALTPGRQRAYLLYFGSAKQRTTREARIERKAGRIMAGRGLED